MVKTNFLGHELPYISYFKFKWHYWNFWENQRVNPHSYLQKNRIQCVISRLENPQKENLIEFYWYWNYIYWKSLDLWQQPVRKYKRYFYCEKRAQRTWTLQFLETCGKLYLGLTNMLCYNIYDVILICLIK